MHGFCWLFFHSTLKQLSQETVHAKSHLRSQHAPSSQRCSSSQSSHTVYVRYITITMQWVVKLGYDKYHINTNPCIKPGKHVFALLPRPESCVGSTPQHFSVRLLTQGFAEKQNVLRPIHQILLTYDFYKNHNFMLSFQFSRVMHDISSILH